MKSIREPEFQSEVLKHSEKVLVNFHAEWCAPCRDQAPIMDSLVAQFQESNGEGNGIKFIRVDVDENLNLATFYQVETVPTFILFENGQPVHRVVGLQSEDALWKIIGVVPALEAQKSPSGDEVLNFSTVPGSV